VIVVATGSELTCLTALVAHHQVPPRLQGQQEANADAPRDGKVSPVSDSGWDPLPPRQLGAPPGSGELLYISYTAPVYTATLLQFPTSPSTHCTPYPFRNGHR